MIQRINKAKNIILYDFPENCEEEDKKFVLDTLAIIPTSFDNISCKRINAERNDGPRMLCVTFQDSSHVADVFKNKHWIAHEVTIRKDRIKRERYFYKKSSLRYKVENKIRYD